MLNNKLNTLNHNQSINELMVDNRQCFMF